ncbi:MAG: hypothetical protein SV775_16230 [Thermodesulfobacteriota bacterium]|nr:hypothetical protein [Thermodesulfobacteriota bacterium]
MGFTVEQECPQCGAPIELDETDHLLRCPYCNVSNFLFTPNYFRFLLPHRAPGKDIIYAPYLRFRGNVFFCSGWNVGHRIVDITQAGVSLTGLPMTLGLRPQAMKMRFVTPDTAGSFLKFSLKASELLKRAGKLPSGSSSGRLFHRAYIGEALSLIYLPMFRDGDRLFDAILAKPLVNLPQGRDAIEQATEKNPRWKLIFMPTLCPQCGWNLHAERDSIVLTCSNCEKAWEASEGRFVPVSFEVAAGGEEHSEYLPFWKISATARGIEINSFSDFVRLTNQPRVAGKGWENEVMIFWSPAFKIRPKVFLRLSSQLTISQYRFQTEETLRGKNLYPVTLPLSEATQAMKTILAGSAVNKKGVLPHLPHLRFDIKDSALVYLPFKEIGSEMIQQHVSISINKHTLEFGRQL